MGALAIAAIDPCDTCGGALEEAEKQNEDYLQQLKSKVETIVQTKERYEAQRNKARELEDLFNF